MKRVLSNYLFSPTTPHYRRDVDDNGSRQYCLQHPRSHFWHDHHLDTGYHSLANLIRLRFSILSVSRTDSIRLGPWVWIFRQRHTTLSPTGRDGMVGTKSPKWTRLHQHKHSPNRVPGRVYDGRDICSGLKYASDVLSFVSYHLQISVIETN